MLGLTIKDGEHNFDRDTKRSVLLAEQVVIDFTLHIDGNGTTPLPVALAPLIIAWHMFKPSKGQDCKGGWNVVVGCGREAKNGCRGGSQKLMLLRGPELDAQARSGCPTRARAE